MIECRGRGEMPESEGSMHGPCPCGPDRVKHGHGISGSLATVRSQALIKLPHHREDRRHYHGSALEAPEELRNQFIHGLRLQAEFVLLE